LAEPERSACYAENLDCDFSQLTTFAILEAQGIAIETAFSSRAWPLETRVVQPNRSKRGTKSLAACKAFHTGRHPNILLSFTLGYDSDQI
jgi:hypothetical protein